MASNGEDRRAPAYDGEVTTASITTTATAAAVIANGPSTTIPAGYYTFENCGATAIHMITGGSASMGAPTATANAMMIAPDGGKIDVYLGAKHTHYRAIAITATSTLRYWRS